MARVVPYDHVLALQIIEALSRPVLPRAIPGLAEEIQETWGEPVDFRVGEGANIVFRVIALLFRSGECVIAMGGVNTPHMGRNMARGYLWDHTTQEVRWEGWNSAVRSEATDILNAVIRPLTSRAESYSLYGHSAGGATVERLAKVIATTLNGDINSIVTYGSPKPAWEGRTYDVAPVRRFRYMADNDPVPLLPSCTLYGPGSMMLIGGSPFSEVDRFVHGSGGLRVSNESLNPRQEGFVDAPPAQAINEWLNRGQPYVRNHSAANYLRLMSRWNLVEANEAAPPVIDRQPAAAQVAEPLNLVLPLDLGPTINFVLPIEVATLRGTTLTIQGGRTVEVSTRTEGPMGQARVRNSLQWNFTKIGKVYNIFWNDFFMGTCSSRSSARTACRAANRLLRVMGNKTTWHAGFIPDAWASFLGEAASGNGQYVPPLRTD